MMTLDSKRNATATPFEALNVLDGSALRRNMQWHRHQEFAPCLNAVEAKISPDEVVCVIGNYAVYLRYDASCGRCSWDVS